MVKFVILWCLRIILAIGISLTGMLLIVLARNTFAEWFWGYGAFFIAVLTLWGASAMLGTSDSVLFKSKESK